MTPTSAEDYALLNMLINKQREEAEKRAVEEYRASDDPQDLLRDRIYGIIACAASATIDYQPPQRPAISEPLAWRENLSRTSSRLQTDTLFHRMVSMIVHEVFEEVDRYLKGCKPLLEREYRDDVLAKLWGIATDGDPDADYDTNNFYDMVREGVEAKKELATGKREVKEFVASRIEQASAQFDATLDALVAERLAERERCSGVLRSFIRYATAAGTDRDQCISLMRSALGGMDPAECKESLSREQETRDAIAQAEMDGRERCARIAEGEVFGCDGTPEGIEIARLIRGEK